MGIYFKIIVLISLLLLSFSGCSKKEDDTIKIGFIAGLSGKYSSLGTSIRDGFILAFDQIDYKIDGKKVKIIQKDDKQDSKVAKKVLEELLNSGVKLIVGNATSAMTSVSFPIINKQKDFVMISATASAAKFTAKDDNFLRIQVEHNEKRYTALKQYIQHHKFNNIFMVYDSKNMEYAKGYLGFFQNMIIESGGNGFIGKADLNDPYESIMKKIKNKDIDLILIVGNSIDSATFIQYLRLHNVQTKILCSGWAKTVDFIKNGGGAVEGVLFASGYDENSKDPKFQNFVKLYKKKYHKEPSVFAAQGYELGQILIQNLKNSTDISTLKDRILEIKNYEGLQGGIKFDKYGDVSREYFMMEVKNHQYQKIEP